MPGFTSTSRFFRGLICFLFLFSLSPAIQCQSLELYNINSQKSKNILNPQDVIIYTLNPNIEKIRGAMHFVNDSTIRINSIQIPLKEITIIKAITPTSRMVGYIIGGISAAYLITGIVTIATASSAGYFGRYFTEVVGTMFVVIGAGAAIPAIRYLFFGKKYRKNAGWVLRVQGP